MKIAIIGGGASGIAAAIYAKRENSACNVQVFERSDRILKKLLATGNGRCNLSNTDMSGRHYFSHSPEYINKILSAFTPEEERQFFESIGIIFCEENGRIYPYSRRANAVADALRFECGHLGVKIRTNAFVEKIEKSEHGFIINGEFFDKVIVSSGGFSAPSFGTDGNSFRLLKSLGHTITRYSYALAPVKVKENVKQLKGIRAHADVTLLRNGDAIRTEKGEVQFTDYGLSGIAVMQLSRLLGENDILALDLMPNFSKKELETLFEKRKATLPHLKAEDFLSGIVHKTLGIFILNRIGISPAKNTSSLTEDEIRQLAENIKTLPFTVSSVLGKEHSQATSGGARLCDFNAETLESSIVPNLYCTGEALDCVGDCGGYNLHWAWATAKIAGKAVSKC